MCMYMYVYYYSISSGSHLNVNSSKYSIIKYAAWLYIINIIRDVGKLISTFTYWYWEELRLSKIILLLLLNVPWILFSIPISLSFLHLFSTTFFHFLFPQSLLQSSKAIEFGCLFYEGWEVTRTKMFFLPKSLRYKNDL